MLSRPGHRPTSFLPFAESSSKIGLSAPTEVINDHIMQGKVKPLSPNNLRLVCDPASLTFENDGRLQPTTAIIGQPRATKALEFGMGLKTKGITSSSPARRARAATRPSVISCKSVAAARRRRTICSICITKQLTGRKAISLPPGQGSHFVEHMKRLIEAIQSALTQAFESSSYREAIHALEQNWSNSARKNSTRWIEEPQSRVRPPGFAGRAGYHGRRRREASEPVANGELQARRRPTVGYRWNCKASCAKFASWSATPAKNAAASTNGWPRPLSRMNSMPCAKICRTIDHQRLSRRRTRRPGRAGDARRRRWMKRPRSDRRPAPLRGQRPGQQRRRQGRAGHRPAQPDL